jgi:hypothetical protein
MTPFHQIEVIENGRIVLIRRSERRFENARELSQERVLMVERLNGIGRAGRALLIDSRIAPSSTDDDMQDEFKRFRLDVARGFDRVATLVRTKVAILQVNRLCADQTVTVQPFNDEALAIEYLLGGLPIAGKRSLRP